MNKDQRTSSTVSPGKRRWLGLFMVSLGLSLIIIDATIVNVSLPYIIHSLGINLSDAEWVVSIYSLVFAALLIPFGRMGDRVGRKRMFIIGILVFLAGSATAGLSPGGDLLIAARVVQGIGGAIILPATISIVNTTFPGHDRAKAFAVWGSVIGGMAALGPLLGGWLTTSFSWRWSFYINIPIGLAVIAGAIFWIKESRDEQMKPGFDAGGFFTLITGLASLVFGLIEGHRYGWWKPKQHLHLWGRSWPYSVSIVPIAFALAILALAAFIKIEISRAKANKKVLADLSLFKIHSFRYGSVISMIVNLGELGIVFVLSLFLQGVLGSTAFQAGLALLSLAVGTFLASAFAAPFSDKFGAHRAVTLGLGLIVIGIAVQGIILSPTISEWALIPWLFVVGLGIGLDISQLENVILSEVPKHKSGQASGMQTTIGRVGSALGVALLGAVLAIILSNETSSGLSHITSTPAGKKAALVQMIKSSAGQVLSELRQQPHSDKIVTVVSLALTDGTRWSAFVAAAFVLAGFFLSWLLPDARKISNTS